MHTWLHLVIYYLPIIYIWLRQNSGHLRFGMDRGYGSACGFMDRGFTVWLAAIFHREMAQQNHDPSQKNTTNQALFPPGRSQTEHPPGTIEPTLASTSRFKVHIDPTCGEWTALQGELGDFSWTVFACFCYMIITHVTRKKKVKKDRPGSMYRWVGCAPGLFHLCDDGDHGVPPTEVGFGCWYAYQQQ